MTRGAGIGRAESGLFGTDPLKFPNRLWLGRRCSARTNLPQYHANLIIVFSRNVAFEGKVLKRDYLSRALTGSLAQLS
jgi:hypothetical protein